MAKNKLLKGLIMSFENFSNSLEKTLKEETREATRRQTHSQYRNVVQCDQDYYNKFVQQNDGSLLQKYNSASTSSKDRQIIVGILESRGYSKHKDGSYGKR